MSIESLPELTNFHTIFDWIRIFRDPPYVIPSGITLNSITGSDLATLLLLCTRQAPPFCITVIRSNEEIFICQGYKELYTLQQFCSNKLMIKKEEWCFSIPFFSNTPNCYYQDLSLYQQTRLMSAPLHAHYLSVNSKEDIHTLLAYYN